MIRNLLELEQSSERPLVAELPLTRWRSWKENPTLADLYKPAFEIEDLAEAEQYFLELLAWCVRMDYQRGEWLTWAQSVAREREQMAFYALAVDASALNCAKGIPPTVGKVARLYGAFLPASCGIGKPQIDALARDIQEFAKETGEPITDQQAKHLARKNRARKVYDWKRNQGAFWE